MRICRLALITTTAVITGNYRSAPRRSMNAVRGEERRSQPPSREEREREKKKRSAERWIFAMRRDAEWPQVVKTMTLKTF